MSIYERRSLSFGVPEIATAENIVVGRTDFVRQLWRDIESGSVRLLAERRIGKTWILHLAMALKPEATVPFFINVEGIHSTTAFVQELNRKLWQDGLISKKRYQKLTNGIKHWVVKLQGQQVDKSAIPKLYPWNEWLNDTCQELQTNHPDKTIVLMIDELPFMLDNLIKANQGTDAIELLNQLRAIRQNIPRLKMVFCGSLGLHLVLNKLKEEHDYSGQPTNDMPPLEVPPLHLDAAYQLAGGLLLGENIPCSNLDAVALAIATASAGVPFYIQHIIKWMRYQDKLQWRVEDIPELVSDLFHAEGDPAEFHYYDTRLDQYYPEDIVEKARVILDILSRSDEPLPFATLRNLVLHHPKTQVLDNSTLLNVLEILRKDHYLTSTKAQEWFFKIEIVRQWWHQHRGQLSL